MANADYLICSFCQGPSSRLLRPKLEPHLSNPKCRIRSSDLDWLDKWRLLMPSHVEWDLHRLHDTELQNEYEGELRKRNVVSGINWVPSIEGTVSQEWDDLDGWRTIDFTPVAGRERPNSPMQGGFEHLAQKQNGSGNVISKRTLHQYNDDINVTRLPLHSACLRILYESCNEVKLSSHATSTVSDVVASILLPSWRDGDVNMDWLSRKQSELSTTRLIAPWGEKWHPLDPETNYLAVDPSRPQHFQRVPSMLIQQPQRTPLSPCRSLPPLLRMPAEVLDLISDFVMGLDATIPRPADPQLDAKVQNLQNLRYTCRQMYHHSFPRIHFLSFLHSECRPYRHLEVVTRTHPSLQFLAAHPQLQYLQYQIHLADRVRSYKKPLLPYRRIPALPPWSQIDRPVMETDWEAVYRSWKEALGWRNRVKMFVRCERWLGDMQEWIWQRRQWGRTANYIVPPVGQENEGQNEPAPFAVGAVNGNGIGAAALIAPDATEEDEEMLDEGHTEMIIGDLEEFQWP